MRIRRPWPSERCGNSLCRQPLPDDAHFCRRCGCVRISASAGRWSTGCLVAFLAAVVLTTLVLVLRFAR
jgi:hypothetical protein